VGGRIGLGLREAPRAAGGLHPAPAQGPGNRRVHAGVDRAPGASPRLQQKSSEVFLKHDKQFHEAILFFRSFS
jgi:hypothetical protein